MAYAAVLSLEQTMDRIYKSKNLLSQSEAICIYNEFPNLNSFLRTIENLPSTEIVDSVSEIRVKDAVENLEDLINSHLSDLSIISDQSESVSSIDDDISFTLLFSQQLPKVKHELTSFLTTLSKNITDKDQQQQQQQQQQHTCRYSSSSDYTSVGNQQQKLLVGLDDQIERVKEWILDLTYILSVKLVVGMTGIGKTTLVQQVYNDPSVVEEFETRLFVHIGPHYNQLEEIQMLVLSQLGITSSDKSLHGNVDYLKRRLWEALSNKRYLIVLDDVWIANDIWVKLQRRGFPDNGRGSCVMIISQIQNSLPPTDVIILPLLKENDSWKLLHQTAFNTSEDKCSRELEKIGKKIARNCDGLPAAIIQVGENLRGKSFQEWKTLSEKEDPLVITRYDDTPLSKALHFSYMMLPQKLKLCFLYMGVFPKNCEIFRSKLTKLWVSEGFVNPTSSNKEKIAGEYLDLLIWRSVVLRKKQASIDIEKFKNCRLHFTFRSLCVNEAKNEKFFHILKKYTDCTPENIRSHRRICVHNNVILAFKQVHEWMESVLNVRSLLCFGPKQQYPILLPLFFRLLKVLDALAIRFYEFPHQILALVHLTYIAITCDGELPNSISRLWNLQVLIFCQYHNIKLSNNSPVYLPIEIWNMQKLKQLYCKGFDLPAPPPGDSHLVLENLLTVSGVSVESCTMEVLSRIPNLKRIAVQIESPHDSTKSFSFIHHFASNYDEFESFKCIVVSPNLRSQVVPCIMEFPVNIKKICLSGCGLPWKNIEVIAALPNLKVLKLRWYAFCGPQWKISDGQFPSLLFLLLEDLDIERLESNSENFINLDHLVVRHCYKLENIPFQLRYNELLEVDDCNPSFVKKIRERRFFGVKIKIGSSIF